MNQESKEKLVKIARLSKDDVGTSEENVKQKIVVPLLEAFGHNRNNLDFEYGSQGKRIDIMIKKDVPKDSKVIIDTKSYDQNLEDHIEQIKTYTRQEDALLAMIVNGNEIRIYSPITGYSFHDSLLYSNRREELVSEEEQITLEKYLGKEQLSSRQTRSFVGARQEEVVQLMLKIERLEGKYDQLRKEYELQLSNLNAKKSELEGEIKSVTGKIGNLVPEREKEVQNLYAEVKIPYSDERDVTTIDDEELVEDSVNVYSSSVVENGQAVEIVLPSPRNPNQVPSFRKYGLIPVSKKIRHFFPGFRVSFTVETDRGEIVTHMVGQKNAEIGDPNAGGYFSTQVGYWLEEHKELKSGDVLMIRKISDRRYKLEIKK